MLASGNVYPELNHNEIMGWESANGSTIHGDLGVVVLREQMQVPIILLSQVLNGMMLPFVLIFMLRLSNREDLMGEHKNTRAFNAIAWVTCVVMIILTVLLLVSQFFHGVPA